MKKNRIIFSSLFILGISGIYDPSYGRSCDELKAALKSGTFDISGGNRDVGTGSIFSIKNLRNTWYQVYVPYTSSDPNSPLEDAIEAPSFAENDYEVELNVTNGPYVTLDDKNCYIKPVKYIRK